MDTKAIRKAIRIKTTRKRTERSATEKSTEPAAAANNAEQQRLEAWRNIRNRRQYRTRPIGKNLGTTATKGIVSRRLSATMRRKADRRTRQNKGKRRTYENYEHNRKEKRKGQIARPEQNEEG
jgi:hypothetical protein